MKRSCVMSFTKSEIMRTYLVEGGRIGEFEIAGFQSKRKESFGLFDSNYNEVPFYPGNSRANVSINKEDYFVAKYRMLSAGIVAAGTYRASNFGAYPGVLKSAMSLFVSVPIMADHERNISNMLGLVTGVSWSDETRAKDGTRIVGGIDGDYAIDYKTHPAIIRNIQLGALNSTSVTVGFDWEPSHTLKNDEEFESLIGTIHPDDGKMVTRNVTKLNVIHEASLVWLGADATAKLYDMEGNLIRIDKTGIAKEYLSASAPEKLLYSQNIIYGGACVTQNELLALSASNKESNNRPMLNEKVIKALLLAFNLAKPEDITEAHIASFSAVPTGSEVVASSELVTLRNSTTELANLRTAKTNLELEVVNLKKDNETAKADKEALMPMAAQGKKVVDQLKADVIKLYKVAAGENVSQVLIDSFEKMGYDELKGHFETYAGKAVTSFTATCNKCSSVDVTLRSSVQTEPAAPKLSKERVVSSYAELSREFLD